MSSVIVDGTDRAHLPEAGSLAKTASRRNPFAAMERLIAHIEADEADDDSATTEALLQQVEQDDRLLTLASSRLHTVDRRSDEPELSDTQYSSDEDCKPRAVGGKTAARENNAPTPSKKPSPTKRLVPWNPGDKPRKALLFADPIPKEHLKGTANKKPSRATRDNKRTNKRPNSRLLGLASMNDSNLLVAVLDHLRSGKDPSRLVAAVADMQEASPTELPTIEKLSRVPAKRKREPPTPVTDGTSFLVATNNCGSFCWTAQDAIRFNSCRYDPKFSFVALVMAWAKVKSRHYWRDCRLTVQIVSETLNYSVAECVALRGWVCKVEEDGSVVVEYGKLKECLARSKHDGRYIELYAMIGRCVSQIEDDKRWEDAAVVTAAEKVRNKITRLSHAYHTAHVVIKELFWPVLPPQPRFRLCWKTIR